jgi:hypothetical protein
LRLLFFLFCSRAIGSVIGKRPQGRGYSTQITHASGWPAKQGASHYSNGQRDHGRGSNTRRQCHSICIDPITHPCIGRALFKSFSLAEAPFKIVGRPLAHCQELVRMHPPDPTNIKSHMLEIDAECARTGHLLIQDHSVCHCKAPDTGRLGLSRQCWA